MSLITVLFVPEGIVLAGDSRLTLTWKTNVGGIEQTESVAASDSNAKIFAINNLFGLGTFGSADINGIPISGFITQFTEEKVSENTTIDELPQLLLDFFGVYPNLATHFYTVGYKIELGISIPHVYLINIAAGTFNRINSDGQNIVHGANWGGEVEILMRLLQNVKVQNGDNFVDLEKTPILWEFFTLQDAIDFSLFAVRTTIETIRFQRKAKTVGGPIDILVIKPNEKPNWISKKQLHV